MNLASALIKRVLEVKDFDTWMNVRKHYLPNEYHQLFDIITKHSERFHKLPTVGELKLEIRDASTLDKVYALESIETESEPFLLLDYLKSEYAQREAFAKLDDWVENTASFETAEEIVRTLQEISINLEKMVELTPDEYSMQKIPLFESDEEMANRITLGLNEDFDREFNFKVTDYILMGGKRGSGKSLTCSNLANRIVMPLVDTQGNILVPGRKALYFSIEMEPREVLQRACAIATKVPFYKIRDKKLDVNEWEKVAHWWSTRYQDGADHFKTYLDHRDFNRFHTALSRTPLVDAFVDIVYDSALTLGRIRAETEKRAIEGTLGAIIVDYINQVKRTSGNSFNGQYDWKEQIEISKALKQLAQDYQVPVFSPYQTDATGEARFAKGILDSADAAVTLDSHSHEDGAITFKVTKMRSARDDLEFTSAVNWSTLVIGPKSIAKPAAEGKQSSREPGEPIVNENVYDDPPF